MSRQFRSLLSQSLAACLVFAASATMMACDENSTGKVARPAPTTASPWTKDHWTKVAPAPAKENTRIDPRYGRTSRRISVLHLRTIVPQVFNGLNWTGNNNVKMLESLGRTLGQADYVYSNQSTNKPTPLFMKFMDDMAGQLCSKAIAADKKNDKTETRMVLRHERSPDTNLRYLRLKFHTIYVPEDSKDGIKHLRTLYDKVLQLKGNSNDAWYAVCVAMVSSPEFFAY